MTRVCATWTVRRHRRQTAIGRKPAPPLPSSWFCTANCNFCSMASSRWAPSLGSRLQKAQVFRSAERDCAMAVTRLHEVVVPATVRAEPELVLGEVL